MLTAYAWAENLSISEHRDAELMDRGLTERLDELREDLHLVATLMREYAMPHGSPSSDELNRAFFAVVTRIGQLEQAFLAAVSNFLLDEGPIVVPKPRATP